MPKINNIVRTRRYQLGLDFQAGSVTAPPRASTPQGDDKMITSHSNSWRNAPAPRLLRSLAATQSMSRTPKPSLL